MAGTLVGADTEHATDLTATGAPPTWRPSPLGRYVRYVVLGLIGLLVVASPHLMPPVSVNVLSRVATFAIIALSLNILIGYTGQVSLGHSAFLGMGAFTSGFVITELQLPWAAAVVAAIIVGAAQAILIGFVSLRVRGLYLALVTLVYAVFAERVLFNIEAITRGGAGMPADRPVLLQGDIMYAYVCIAAVALVWVLDWRLTSSKAGRAIEAIRDSERVAASWGINVTAYKLFAFVLSGAIAGLAGALFASIEQIVSPLTFVFTLSLTFLLMTIVGGVGSRPGVVLGAIVFTSLAFGLDQLHEQFEWFPLDGSAEGLVGALLVLIVLLYVPGGLAQLFRPVFRWLSFGPWRLADSGGGPGGPGGGGDARP
jgi:branched-chain amino acid transport system permease protein